MADNRFRAARKRAGKTVRDVVGYLSDCGCPVSDVAVYQWEGGTTTPRPDKIILLARFYGCTVDDLLYGP